MVGGDDGVMRRLGMSVALNVSQRRELAAAARRAATRFDEQKD